MTNANFSRMTIKHDHFFKQSLLFPLSIILTIFIVGCTPGIHAIKCWTCQSNVDPKCADPFDNSTLPITDCDAIVREDLGYQSPYETLVDKELFSTTSQHIKRRPLYCRKIRQKVKGEWRTIRGCAFLGEVSDDASGENNCIMRQGTYDTFMEVCTCKSKDGCNSGPTTLPNTLAIIIMLSLLLVFSISTINH